MRGYPTKNDWPDGLGFLSSNHQLESKGRFVLASRDYDEGIHILAFPKHEHLPDFVKAQATLAVGGPGTGYPGSIGSLWARLVRNRFVGFFNSNLQVPATIPAYYLIDYVQGHYRVKTNPKTANSAGLPRKLATEYGGWRVAALEKAIEIAHSYGFPLVVNLSLHAKLHHVPSESIDENPKRRQSVMAALEKDVRAAAARMNARNMSREGDLMIIRPPNSD